MHSFRPTILTLGLFVSILAISYPREASAETLPALRPALVGGGPGSLVNLIDAQALFQKGQRDAWVMFDCGIGADGIAFGSDFFTTSPNANLLREEVRKRMRQTRFIPAVYDHKRVEAWFSGTVLFVVTDGKPHLRVYANQDLDEIRRGADFVAPQLVFAMNRDYSNWPHYPSKATHDEAAGVLKLRHSVDANGKTTDLRVISEPQGYGLGDYLKKVLPRVDFTPAYRNGKPTATTYTLTWWFGRVVGR